MYYYLNSCTNASSVPTLALDFSKPFDSLRYFLETVLLLVTFKFVELYKKYCWTPFCDTIYILCDMPAFVYAWNCRAAATEDRAFPFPIQL